MVSQGESLDAVQPHPACVFTVTVPLPAVFGTAGMSGGGVNE